MENQEIKSFARRIGKSLSRYKKNLLDNLLPYYLIAKEDPLKKAPGQGKIILEIGIGMSEHFAHQAKINPNHYFIGAEPYLNGIASCLDLAQKYELHNIGLWPDSVDEIITHIKPNSLDIVYLLFPDPWLKNKQKKRRFASIARLIKIKNLLRPGGNLIFASDIEEYATDITKKALEAGFENITKNETAVHEGYITTKFHAKGMREGRDAFFLTFQKGQSQDEGN
ncbi:MAG: hypothetical protein SFT91_02325 [Rickettsiaceae bacterium]|nr:hypothetical protein [Rickettsiaceae bacterium]